MKPEPASSDETVTIDSYSPYTLAPDESFCWSLQEPDLDTDLFNLPHGSDFDHPAFDYESGSKEWTFGRSQSSLGFPYWQQLAKLASPACQSRSLVDGSSLTPTFAALDFPKERMFDKLDHLVLEPRRHDESLEENSCRAIGKYLHDPNEKDRLATLTLEHHVMGNTSSVGAYTKAERAAKILRYREKRARRNFTKRVLYGCRKEFADSRPRVGGRFVIDENRVVKPRIFLKRGRPRKNATRLMPRWVSLLG